MISVLYVDDEPALLELGKQFLEKRGFLNVDTVTSATEALDKIAGKTYDAIISDYQMPEMDGIEFLKRVRASGSTVPFIIFTGRGREEVVIEALNEGADFYLQKGGEPLSQFVELAHKIQKAVLQSRAEASVRDHERRESDIINFLPDATFAIDNAGVVISWNRAMEKMTGILAAEILGKGNFEYAVPFYRERRPILIDLVLREDPATEAKYPYIRRSGAKLFSEITISHMNEGKGAELWFTASPLYDTHGTIVGAIESIRDITDRKEAERALNESEKRFRELSDLLPQAVYEADSEGRLTYANRIGFEMFGYTPGELKVGLEILDVIAPEDRQRAGEAFRRAMGDKTFRSTRGEYKALRKDGSTFPVSIYSSPIYGDDRITGIRGIIVDISEREEADKALRESERKFRMLSENSRDGIYRQSLPDGRYDYISPAFLAITGFSPEEYYKKPSLLWEIIHPDWKQYLHEIWSGLLKGDIPPFYEFRIIHKSGEARWINQRNFLIRDSEGRPAAIEGIVTDVTERKLDEEALRESEEKYRTVFETTGTATVLIENDGTISLANSEFLRLSGHRKDEIENKKKWTEYVIKEDLERMLKQHRLRRQDSKSALSHYEFRYLSKSGEIRDIYLTIDLIPGTTKSVASLLDITDRKRAEANLIAANREFEELLSQIQDVYYRSDSEGRLIRASRSWATVLGYDDVSECLGRSIADDFYLHPADRETFLEKVYRDGKVTDYEVELKRKDGSGVLVATSSHLYYDPAGNILGVEGTFRDITERKQQDHILRSQLELGIALQSVRGGLEGTLKACLNAAIGISGMDSGGIYLVDNKSGSLDLVVSENLGEGFVKSVSHYPPESENSLMVKAGKPIYLQFSETGVVHSPVQEQEGLKALAVIPIVYKNRIIACLNITSHTVDDIPGNARVALETIATQIGAAIERIRTDEALKESEQRYRNVVEDQSEFISRFLPDGTHVFVNEAYCRYFRLNREEILGHRFKPMIPAEDQEKVRQFFQSLTPDNPVGTIEHRIVMPDGEVRWQRWSDRAIFSPSGKVTEYQSVGRDTTDKKNAELALEKSELRYRTLLSSVNEGIWVINADAVTTFVNPIMAEMLGYTPDEMTGRHLFDYIGEAGRVLASEKISLRKKGLREQHEFEFIRKDGSPLKTLLNTSPLFDPDGSFAGAIATVIDIGRLNETEIALRMSEERLRTIMQAIQTGIIIIEDGTHTLLDANPEALAMMGVERDEAIGSACDRFFSPPEPADYPVNLEVKVAGATEETLVTDQGLHIPVLTTVIPALIGGKKVLVKSISDISELKSKEERIKVLAGLLDLIPASVTVHDPGGNFLYANQKTFQYHGYPEEEFYRLNLHEIDVPESEQLINERIQQMKETGEASFEVRHFRRDRSLIPLLVNAKITTWGKDLVILSVAQDITERKAMEEALRIREEAFAALADNSPDIIVRFDTGLRHLFVNRTAERETGFSTSGIIGRRPGELSLPGSLASIMEESLQKALSSGTEYHVATEVATPAGLQSFETRIIPERNADGSIKSLLAITRNITARKRHEEELVSMYREYMSLLEQIQDVYYKSDINGRLIRVSQSMAEMLGYDEIQDLIGKNISAEFYVNPTDREKFLEEVTRNGKVINYVVQLKKKDGSSISISAYSHLWYNPDGTIGGVEGTFRDITDQRRMEDVLRESEEKYRLLFEQSNDAIFIADPETRMLLDCNRRAETLTGYSRQEILTMKADQLHPQDVTEKTMEFFREYTHGMDTSTESVVITRSNKRVPVSINASRIERSGRTLLIGIFRDITDQKQAEDALRQRTYELDYQNRLISTLLDTVPIGIFMVETPSGRPIIANSEATRILGRGILDDARRENLAEVYAACRLGTSEPYPKDEMPIIRGMHGESSHVDDMVVLRPDGTRVQLEVFGSPVVDREDRIIASLVSFMDITDRKLAEQLIRETNKKINLLTSITRHDVANQVTILKGYTQLAMMNNPDPETAEILSKIEMAGTMIARQIEFTKTYEELGQHAPAWHRVDEIAEKQKRDELSLTCTCSAEVFADPMLEKVFFNLIDNSVQHGEKVKSLSICCKETPEGLLIILADDGIGIPLDMKEKIFEKGFGKNTGLGLFLAREILAITGITIRETGTPGEGAVFILTVPKGAYRISPRC